MATSNHYTTQSELLIIEGRELDGRNMRSEVKTPVFWILALPFNGYIITLDNWHSLCEPLCPHKMGMTSNLEDDYEELFEHMETNCPIKYLAGADLSVNVYFCHLEIHFCPFQLFLNIFWPGPDLHLGISGNICAIEQEDRDENTGMVSRQILVLYIPKPNPCIIVHPYNGDKEPHSNKSESKITIDRAWEDPGKF